MVATASILYLFLRLFRKSRNLKYRASQMRKSYPGEEGTPLVRIGFLVFPYQPSLVTDATITFDKGNENVVPAASISQCADRKRNTARFYYRKVEPQ